MRDEDYATAGGAMLIGLVPLVIAVAAIGLLAWVAL